MELPVLDAIDQRILGSLLEKQRTVPASYPLTLNSLRLACNQTSSRDPVSDHSDADLEAALKELRHRGLVRVVWADTGKRTLKYHQLLDETLGLQPDERALVTVLLLRGPQAAGELKTRTERLHDFADRAAVEHTLARLAALPTPLVRELPRRAGQHDARWVHLLGPVPEQAAAAAASAPPAVDRDSVIADGVAARDERILATYAAVAEDYARAHADAMDGLPFERWLLTRAVEEAPAGPIVDVGCGTGVATAFLAECTREQPRAISGIDLSPAMIAQAQALLGAYPDVTFSQGDFRRLLKPAGDAGWAVITAFYSLIHLADSELDAAVGALARTLQPGGVLVVGVHLGAEVKRMTQWWDHEVSLDFVLMAPERMPAAMAAAGLTEIETYGRGPMPGSGETTQRGYFLGRRPG